MTSFQCCRRLQVQITSTNFPYFSKKDLERLLERELWVSVDRWSTQFVRDMTSHCWSFIPWMHDAAPKLLLDTPPLFLFSTHTRILNGRCILVWSLIGFFELIIFFLKKKNFCSFKNSISRWYKFSLPASDHKST
jgi:hypothetical protein